MRLATTVLLASCCLPLWASLPLQFNKLPKDIESSLREEIELLHEQSTLSANDSEQIQKRSESILELFGFYHATVSVSPQEQGFKVNVTLGEPITIQQIYFNLEGEGRSDPLLKDIERFIFLKVDETFTDERYEDGKSLLLSRIQEHGYRQAQFTTARVEIDIENNTAQVFWTIDTMPLHRFGQTHFKQHYFYDSFLQRFKSYDIGERYATEDIVTFQDGLQRSGYFSKVLIEPVDQENNLVDIHTTLEPAKPNLYQLGLGFGTDTGIRGRARWQRRYVNPCGHQLGAGIHLSTIHSALDAYYRIPLARPVTDHLQWNIAYNDDEYGEKPARIFTAQLREQRQLGQWQRILSLMYLNEEDQNLLIEGKRHTVWLLPEINFHRVQKDDPLNPTHGKSFTFKLKGGYQTSDTNRTFVQPYAHFRWLHGVNDWFSILFRQELGSTLPSEPQRLPLSQRFFAGGDNSLRGFSYRSLPDEINDDGAFRHVGGAHLAISSLEGRALLHDPFGAHAYIDAGNAFRDKGDRIEVGAGAGFFYQTPLGPLKASLAQPLTKGAHSLRLHVQFGAEL